MTTPTNTDPITDAELDAMIAQRQAERAEKRRAHDRERARARRNAIARERKRYADDRVALDGTPHGAVPPSFWST